MTMTDNAKLEAAKLLTGISLALEPHMAEGGTLVGSRVEKRHNETITWSAPDGVLSSIVTLRVRQRYQWEKLDVLISWRGPSFDSHTKRLTKLVPGALAAAFLGEILACRVAHRSYVRKIKAGSDAKARAEQACDGLDLTEISIDANTPRTELVDVCLAHDYRVRIVGILPDDAPDAVRALLALREVDQTLRERRMAHDAETASLQSREWARTEPT